MNYRFFSLVCALFVSVSISGCAVTNVVAEREEAYKAYIAGDYEEAAKKFEILAGQIPKDAELWFRLGNSYAKGQQPKKAVEAYENALLRNPALAKAWHNKGLIHLQQALKSYTDMQMYVPADDPVAREGKMMRNRIFEFLEGSAGGKQDID